MIKFYDTSAFIEEHNYNVMENNAVSSITIKELEELKYKYRNDNIKLAEIRSAINIIKKQYNKTMKIVYNNYGIKYRIFLNKYHMTDNNDSKIIYDAYTVAKKSKVEFITNDLSQTIFANKINFYSVKSIDNAPFNSKYINGWSYCASTEEYANDIINNNKNIFNLHENEYINFALGDKKNIICSWHNGIYTPIDYKDIHSRFMGDIKPRNEEQKMLFALLQNSDIKVKTVLGKFGSGKTYIMLAHAIDMVQRGKFDKIVFIRNNIQVKDTKDIGSLPGSSLEKIFPYLMPVADHVGGVDGLLSLIDDGIIDPIHLGFLRGRDFKRAIIFCDECENLTKQHIQLILGRAAEGSQVWFAGDLKQTDNITFEKNSGLVALINNLRDNPLFGMVRLIKSERSEIAQLADQLD